MVEYSVLIIDDDPWMQRILSKTLQSYGFRNVMLASNGFEGIAIAVEEKPHLIILDIMMPELSGHLTLKILKAIKLTKNIPVLMVSALSDTENLGKAVKIGTAGFISKPFTRSTIYEKLVAIYGVYNLDLIVKGEPIDMYQEPAEEEDLEDDFFDTDDVMFDDLKIAKEKEDKPAAAKGGAKSGSPGAVSRPEAPTQDKKSIDAIKKMLLKR